MRGPVSGVYLVKTGSGALVLNGDNSFSYLRALEGSLVFAPENGTQPQPETTLSNALYGYGGSVVCSNAAMTIAANSFVNSGGMVTLADGSVLNVGNIRFGNASGRGDFIVDGSTVTSRGALLVGAAAANYDGAGNGLLYQS